MRTRRVIAIAVLLVVYAGVIVTVRACQKSAPAPVRIKSGQVTVLGDVKWTVINVLKTDAVGSDDGKVNAKNWFLLVDLYLTNGGEKKVTLNPAALTLTDGNKNSYQIDKKATDAYIKGLSNPKLLSVFATTIPVQTKKRSVMVFSIPETANKLVLNVDRSSVGADRDLIIDLGF